MAQHIETNYIFSVGCQHKLNRRNSRNKFLILLCQFFLTFLCHCKYDVFTLTIKVFVKWSMKMTFCDNLLPPSNHYLLNNFYYICVKSSGSHAVSTCHFTTDNHKFMRTHCTHITRPRSFDFILPHLLYTYTRIFYV